MYVLRFNLFPMLIRRVRGRVSPCKIYKFSIAASNPAYTRVFFCIGSLGPRALAGVGGGGIVSSVWVITAEIVEVRHRAKWSQAFEYYMELLRCCGPSIGRSFSAVRIDSTLISGLYLRMVRSGNTDSILSWRCGM